MELKDFTEGFPLEKPWLNIVSNSLTCYQNDSENIQCNHVNCSLLTHDVCRGNTYQINAGTDTNSMILYKKITDVNIETTGNTIYSMTNISNGIANDCIGSRPNLPLGIFKPSDTSISHQYRLVNKFHLSNTNITGGFIVKFYLNNFAFFVFPSQLLSNNDYLISVSANINVRLWNASSCSCILSGKISYTKINSNSSDITAAVWTDAVINYIDNKIIISMSIENPVLVPYSITRKMYYISRIA